MSFGRLQRYWHTLRYLRPVQVYGRIWFRLSRRRPDLRAAPPSRPHTQAWNAPGLRPRSMIGPAQFRFLRQTHPVDGPRDWNLSQRDKLWLYNLHYFDDLNAVDADARTGWHRALITRWIDENPPGRGNGWEPYPTSLRMVNWVKWALRQDAPPGEGDPARVRQPSEDTPAALNRADGPTLSPLESAGFQHSLAVQARWLRRRLEHHLLGNHLFANAKALVFAGAFFRGEEAAGWLGLGQRLLVRELREQILADGGHFERSPMYHAILLEDVLDLLHLAECYPGALDAKLVSLCRDRARAMLAWLAAMTHPDGDIGFFNDAAFGIAPRCDELARFAATLKVPASGSPMAGSAAAPENGPAADGSRPLLLTHLRESGYVRVEAGPAVTLLDVAPIGPDYLPGHAHADTLSFELSLFGQRVIVNGGTSRYGTGPERSAERGTAAHSTVEIDGQDSSEVWGGFRVARRARPFDVRVETLMDDGNGGELALRGHDAARLSADEAVQHSGTGGLQSDARVVHSDPGDVQPDAAPGIAASEASDVVADTPRLVRVTAAHDGYRRLPGNPVHRRQWEITADRMRVTDWIKGPAKTAVARLHLHPDVRVEFYAKEACADPTGTGEVFVGTLRLPEGQRVRWRLAGGEVELEPGHWHPEFGHSVRNRCLVLRLAGNTGTFKISWDAADGGGETT